jgi:hypothetical protein
MAAPVTDAGLSSMIATMPCMTRRWLGRTANQALFVNYDLFPWKGQNIDTPPRVTTKWTTDDDVRPAT